MRILMVLTGALLALASHAGPVCMPADAGGPGTRAVQAMVLYGRPVSSNPADAPANGGTLAAGGKAVWWWCPGADFRGHPFWTLEWYGWEFAQDQHLGMQGFRPDDEASVRAAWDASRQIDMTRTYFPTNVMLAAQSTRPQPEAAK